MYRQNEGNSRVLNRVTVIAFAFLMLIPISLIPMGVVAPGPDVNPTIEEIISKVSLMEVENYITDLQNFQTRYGYTTECNQSAQYIFDEFASYPEITVENDYFVYNSYLVRNVIATLPGMNESDETVYVVGGHYDSTSNTDRWNNAPGADDDASGTAVALEAARVLSDYRFNSTIKFAAWTVEEMGLIGSARWVKNAATSGMDIGAYLNFDMIGYDPLNEMGLDIGYNDDSIWLANEMVSINENYTIGLNITTGSGGGASDHASFWQWGYTAVECIESNFNTPNYHTINDTVDKLNMDFDTKVTKLGIATLAKLAGVLTPGVGVVYLDRVSYQPDGTVQIKLYDTDLNTNPTMIDFAVVEMTSDTESFPEIALLMETGTNTDIFMGTIALDPGFPTSDGILQVSEGDTIYANYNDAMPSGIRSATARVDGIPPVISNVSAFPGVDRATITWTTDEPSDSRVYYGISPSLGIEVYDPEMVTSHSVDLYGLEPSLLYYFDVESTDYAGNIQRDDNTGAHYTFTTLLGITASTSSGYIGYVKESDSNGNYFDGPDILVGHGAQGEYHGAAQFNNLWYPVGATISYAKVEFFGKRWHYTGSGGNWILRMLEDDIDADWQNHGYTEINGAVIEDTVAPIMQDDDIDPFLWHTFTYDPAQYSTLQNHIVNGTISFRLDGPQSGRYLYVWDTGNTDESLGSEYAPKITIAYDPTGDTQGPVISNLQLTPNPTSGTTVSTLTGMISDTGLGGSNIHQVRYYDPFSDSWVNMIPEDGFFNSPTENMLAYIDIDSWPDGNYTIFVRGMDEYGNWGDMVSIVLYIKPTFDLPLSYGWNLISIPLNQTDTTLSNVFSSISGSYDAVQYYDSSDSNDPWKHNHNQKSPLLNDLADVDHTMGIWIHITEPGGVVLECTGTADSGNVPIALKSGWNHVGYPSLVNKSRTVGLNNLVFGSDVDAIWTYDTQSGLWEELGEFDEFEAGRGYWIHSKVETTWLVPN
jgi:hypothetical protein